MAKFCILVFLVAFVCCNNKGRICMPINHAIIDTGTVFDKGYSQKPPIDFRETLYDTNVRLRKFYYQSH